MTIESPAREPLLVVHYEGWNKYYDEIIKQSSPRLAPYGLYTSRKDIPKYYLKEQNSMLGHIINRIIPNTQVKGQGGDAKTANSEDNIVV